MPKGQKRKAAEADPLSSASQKKPAPSSATPLPDADVEKQPPARFNTATPPSRGFSFRYSGQIPLFAAPCRPATPITSHMLEREMQSKFTQGASIQFGEVVLDNGEIKTPAKSTSLTFICSLDVVDIYRKVDSQDSYAKTKYPESASSAPVFTDEEKLKILSSLAPVSSVNEKVQTHTFTHKDIKKIASKRIPTQSQVIAPHTNHPAATLAKLCQLDTTVTKWEYGHLIAHRFLGDKAQTANNLIVMTDYCNSLMLLLENEIGRLAKKTQSPIQLAVTAQLEEDSLKKQCHFAKLITYHIKCEDPKIDLKITFDPYLKYKPPNNIARIMRSIFDANIERNLLKKELEEFLDLEEFQEEEFEIIIQPSMGKNLDKAFRDSDSEDNDNEIESSPTLSLR